MADWVSVTPIDEAGIQAVAKALYEHAQIRTVPRPFERASAPTKATYLAEAHVAVSAYLEAVGAEVEYGLSYEDRDEPHTTCRDEAEIAIGARDEDVMVRRLRTPWKPLTDMEEETNGR